MRKSKEKSCCDWECLKLPDGLRKNPKLTKCMKSRHWAGDCTKPLPGSCSACEQTMYLIHGIGGLTVLAPKRLNEPSFPALKKPKEACNAPVPGYYHPPRARLNIMGEPIQLFHPISSSFFQNPSCRPIDTFEVKGVPSQRFFIPALMWSFDGQMFNYKSVIPQCYLHSLLNRNLVENLGQFLNSDKGQNKFYLLRLFQVSLT